MGGTSVERRVQEVTERLETIKELVKKIESILYDEWRQQELTILIESLYYDDHVDWLIKQAEKREYWMKQHRKRANELEDAYFKIQLIENQLHQAQAKAERYKQALEFYADEEHYKEKLISEAQYDADGICISNDEYAPPIIYFDSGELARQALEGEK